MSVFLRYLLPFATAPVRCSSVFSKPIDFLKKKIKEDRSFDDHLDPSLFPASPKIPKEPKEALPTQWAGSNPSISRNAPIQFENFAQEFNLMAVQDSYDGLRVEAAKPVSASLVTNQSLYLGTSMNEDGHLYQIGPTFALPDESCMIAASYGTDQTMILRGYKKFNNTNLKLSVISSLVDEERNSAEGSLDFSRNDWCLSTKLAWQGSLVSCLEYSQMVTPHIHGGCRLTRLAANGATIGTLGLRMEHRDHIWNASVTRQPNYKSMMGPSENIHTVLVQYCRKVSDRLSLGTEIEMTQDTAQRDSALRVVYDYRFRQARVQGSLSAGGNACMTAQTATGFGVSANVDFWRNVYKFGFMFQLIPQTPVSSSTPA